MLQHDQVFPKVSENITLKLQYKSSIEKAETIIFVVTNSYNFFSHKSIF